MKTRPSISQTLLRLTHLAAEVGAEFTHLFTLDNGGAVITLFWDNALGTGLGSVADLPREASIWFETQGVPEGRFSFAFVADPNRYLHCVDEGLTDQQAEDECRRLVMDLPTLEDYLLGRPYRYAGAGQFGSDRG